MNRSAPDFELGSEPYHSSAAAAVHLRRKAPGWTEDELMEIIWQNGLVALPVNRSTTEAVFPGPTGDVSGGGGVPDAANRFMEDDEMATWLNDQTAEDEDGGGLLHGELGMRYEPEATATKQEPTVVGSNATPTAAVAVEGSAVVGSNVTPAAAVILEEPRRMTASSSGMAERKRKKASGAGEEQPACHLDQDAEFESGERGKDDSPRYASVRKLRAAEIHNLSERRRRDRINEKMRALQELIPRCNKSDKASTLDEAIEYMKFLQLQVQVMSMRCNPGPVMFPGVQTYLPPMGMGMQMGLGMGMGMGLGMTVGTDMAASSLGRRMLQYGPIPCPPVAGHPPVQLGPGPLSSSFHLSTISIADQARVEAMKQQNHLSDTVDMRSPNVVQIPHIADPYHRFLSLHPLVQSQSRLIDEAGISKRNGNTESNNG